MITSMQVLKAFLDYKYPNYSIFDSCKRRKRDYEWQEYKVLDMGDSGWDTDSTWEDEDF